MQIYEFRSLNLPRPCGLLGFRYMSLGLLKLTKVTLRVLMFKVTVVENIQTFSPSGMGGCLTSIILFPAVVWVFSSSHNSQHGWNCCHLAATSSPRDGSNANMEWSEACSNSALSFCSGRSDLSLSSLWCGWFPLSPLGVGGGGQARTPTILV